MRFFRAILPNLSIALQLALAVLVILDVFNPRIGLLSGLPFVVLFAAAAVCALATAVVLYRDWRVNRKNPMRNNPHLDE